MMDGGTLMYSIYGIVHVAIGLVVTCSMYAVFDRPRRPVLFWMLSVLAWPIAAPLWWCGS